MSDFLEIKPEALDQNVFNLIGKEWMLITAEADGNVNTMTAAWGGFGVMWNKNVVYIVIRPSRFTKDFVDHAENFSLTFFKPTQRNILNYLGTVSGRDENKIQQSGLQLLHDEGIPYFKEAYMAILCKKLYAQVYQPECFVDQTLIEKLYPLNDFHTLYIAEITKVLLKP